MIFRVNVLLSNAWFDAIAPYHTTAVGVYPNLGRWPISERLNNHNRNVAIMYASDQILNSMMPTRTADWRNMLLSVGLDPGDSQRNTTTPIGIGNMAADAVLAAQLHDGMNQLGDEGGCRCNCLPYANYLGYRPVNTAYDLIAASRWQPYVKHSGNGIFTAQQFVTPQYALTRPYTYTDPSIFQVPDPTFSDVNNLAQYKEQADSVLAASAALNDTTKMQSEFFDDKFLGHGGSIVPTAISKRLPLNEFVHYDFLTNLAAFDAGIAGWHWKYHYDAVRPFSAIKYLYGDAPVTAWGGPGKGTVNDIPASQWRQYLNIANISYTFQPGSSEIEPGITPAKAVTLSYPTWTEWASKCAQSRVDGGVHFPASIEYAHLMGEPIADLAYDFVMRRINGQQ